MVDFRKKLKASALICASFPLSVSAQSRMEVVTPGGVMPAGSISSMDPSDRLAMNLRLLSQNPYDVTALTQAGESALAVGDANAAISFLARAEELSPASGRVKASLASALVQLERPTEAMRLFAEAQGLGISEQMFAKDRGLAFDLRGENKRAQRDYALALRSGYDEEVTRRLAMSLGISGDKEDALRMLEPLIRRNDQGAWRARAFVLAMNGDTRGAEKIADRVVPPGMMASFSTFMRRLATLNPAERAHAVNFGSMPSQEVRYASVNTNDPFRPIDAGSADSLSPAPPADLATAASTGRGKLSREPRRRPGRNEVALASATPSFLSKPRADPPAPAAVRPTIAPSAPAAATTTATLTPTFLDTRSGKRVGERLGPVDPARLPESIRPPLPNTAPAAPPTVTLMTGMSSLPAPTSARSPVSISPSVNVASTPSVATPSAAALIKPANTLLTQAPTPTPTQTVFAPTPTVKPVDVAPPVQSPPVAPAPALFEIGPAKIAPSAAIVQNMPPVPVPAPQVTTPALTTPTVTMVAAAPAATLSAAAPQSLPTEKQLIGPSLVPPAAIQPALMSAPAGAVQRSISTPATVSPLSAVALTPPAGTPVATAVSVAPAPGFSEAITAPIQANDPAASIVTPLPSQPAIVEMSATPTISTSESATPVALASAAVPTPLSPATSVSVPIITPIEAPNPIATPAPVGLASVLSGITPEEESRGGPVLSEAEFRKARLIARRKAEAESLAETQSKTEQDSKRKEEEERRRVTALSPPRIWVQIATGSNRSGLSTTVKKLRDQAPDALKGLSAASVPYKATNRILVGPFKSQAEARSTVNKLAKQGVSATTFTSDAGQDVAKLSSK
jgi:Flp pilus assembly protein TadD